MRIILVGHEHHQTTHARALYNALEKVSTIKTLYVESAWPRSIREIDDYSSYDACIWFVRFRELIQQPGFDWCDFGGRRVMYDWDVHLNYHSIVASQWKGLWPEVFRRNGFQLLVTTGRQCHDSLLNDNVPSYWLPKGYDQALISDLGLDRHGLCYFGTLYNARRAMIHYLKKKRMNCTIVKCPHHELNANLNRYAGCLICNMAGTIRPGIHKLINKAIPSRGIRLEAGFELMIKNFEVAGAGCAPIADWVDEMSDLGFIEGETVVSYRTFDELVEKLRYYHDRPDELRQIGKNAATLALNRHTWDHRAQELVEYLAS